MRDQVTCRWVWQRQSRTSHEAFIMAGSQCWQKTETMDGTTNHVSEAGETVGVGRWQVWT